MKNVIIFALMASFSIVSAIAETYHVKPDGNDNYDGLTWQNSFLSIQKALETATISDEIFVAEGTYFPTSSNNLDIGNRNRHFRLSGGVALYGGFPNTGSPTFEERNPSVFKSIISGDLKGDDFWNEQTKSWENRDDNCYHLFLSINDKNKKDTSILDGFTIQSGNADANEKDTVNSKGGAVYYSDQILVVNNCVFKDNFALNGGAIFSRESDFIIKNSMIIKNSALNSGGGLNSDNSNIKLINSVIADNSAITSMGGGIRVDFWGFTNTTMEITNCTITNNYSKDYGGGILIASQSWVPMMDSEIGNCKILNSILWGNHSKQFENSNQMYVVYVSTSGFQNTGKTTLDYCLTAPGISTLGGGLDRQTCFNISDPLFVGTGDNPYHVKNNSPCKDKGNNDFVSEDFDIRGKGFPRILNGSDGTFDGIVDLGAYEFNALTDIVSVNDTENNLDFEIFPNPTSDFINIYFSEKSNLDFNGKVTIFNILGFEVLNYSVTNEIKSINLNINSLESGVYYIQFGGKTEKFVKY